MDLHMEIPEAVSLIIRTLTKAGYEAYAVGGCVRDSILGRTPDDWDITTSAKPDQVKELFGRTVDTGIAHGTVTVLIRKEGFEVTTYRIDGEYRDGRHPDHVEFTPSLREDLKRRDFTINAMAYNPDTGLVDLFGGQQDLREGKIRCVGDAGERFNEDALRILRAVRFAAQLGFEIEEDTKKAIKRLSANLGKISKERIQTELVKLLLSPHPQELRNAWELSITKVILPWWDEMMERPQEDSRGGQSAGDHTLSVLGQIEPTRVLRLAALFYNAGSGEESSLLAGKTLKDLKFDNDTIYQVKALCLWHDREISLSKPQVRRAMNQLGSQLFPELLALRRADCLMREENEEQLLRLARLTALYEEIKDAKDPITLKDLAVTGSDLIRAGMKPGKGIGEMLQRMLEEVLDCPEHNDREWLLHHFLMEE